MADNQGMKNRVREWRHRRGLSMEELARRIRTTASQISKLERGQRRLTVDWMTRLARALNCRREDLLPNDSAGRGRAPSLDRDLLQRIASALTTHLAKEELQLSGPRFFETALALHDIIAARPRDDVPDALPPELKSMIRLISGD